MYYISKLDHLAHYKEPKQSKQTSMSVHLRVCAHTINKIAWRGEISDDLKDGSVADDLTLYGRQFQTESAA